MHQKKIITLLNMTTWHGKKMLKEISKARLAELGDGGGMDVITEICDPALNIFFLSKILRG
jgi:hypothetical protein